MYPSSVVGTDADGETEARARFNDSPRAGETFGSELGGPFAVVED